MEREQLFEVRRRTFDTPEFRGIEFIEAEAKSIINHVPGSYLPFNWTINPYRGCSHACSYCFARNTHTFLDFDYGEDFNSQIVVKVNAEELLRKELSARTWHGEHIAMGTNVSVGSVDRDLWRSLEPGTPSPQKRLEVCRALNEAGIACGVLMAPIIPFLTDSPTQLRAAVKAIAEAGA